MFYCVFCRQQPEERCCPPVLSLYHRRAYSHRRLLIASPCMIDAAVRGLPHPYPACSRNCSNVVCWGSSLPSTVFSPPTCASSGISFFLWFNRTLSCYHPANRCFECYHPANRCFEQNFSTLFLVANQRLGY